MGFHLTIAQFSDIHNDTTAFTGNSLLDDGVTETLFAVVLQKRATPRALLEIVQQVASLR